MSSQRMACLALVLGALLLSSTTAGAQSSASGTIAGTVRDTTGAVIPGVTVEATSPALIEKVRSVVSDDQGNYKIVDLRPGPYTVTFTLPGFSTFKREGIDLTTGFTASVNAEMKVGSLEETVTVSTASPVVDLQNVRQTTVFKKELQDELPMGRNIMQWAVVIPGAMVGSSATQDVGGTSGKAGFFGIHGMTVTSAAGLFQDGMLFTSADTGIGNIANTASIEESQVQTSGMGAETQTGIVQLNLVPRDGGNTFKLTSGASYSNHSFQSKNIDSALIARGAALAGDLKLVRLFNVGIGGPIKRDKLWFYTAHQWSGSGRYQPGNYSNANQGLSLVYAPDLNRQAFTDDTELDHQYRITWQVSAKNKVNVHVFDTSSCLCYFYGTGVPTAPEATTRISVSSPMFQITWSHPATNRLLFEAGITTAMYLSGRPRQPGVTDNTISVLDSSRNYRYNSLASGLSGIGVYGPDHSDQSNQRVSMSYITGSHAFKVGAQPQQGWRRDSSVIIKDVSYTFGGATPQSVTYWATPIAIIDRSREMSIYAQDQWTIKRLTMNLGVRYDHFRGYDPAQHLDAGAWVPARDFPAKNNIPNWSDIVPRLGGAYDLFGNGKTALKVSVGKYMDFANAGKNVAPQNALVTMVQSATRVWNDANKDYIPQDDELGPLSNANFGKTVITSVTAKDALEGWGKRFYNWQVAAQVQQELRPGMAVNIGYFRIWYGNFTVTDNLAVTPGDFSPYCVTVPTDARLPNSGQQLCGMADISAAKFGLVNNLIDLASKYGKQTQVFNGVDATMNWRFGKGGFVQGGLSFGQTVTDRCFVVDSPQEKQFCHVAPSWASQTQAKFSAAYPLMWDLRASVIYQSLAGIPQPASYVATNAQVADTLGRNLGACGTRVPCTSTVTIPNLFAPQTLFERRLQQVDVRFSRIFKVHTTRLTGNLDVANLFNDNSVIILNSRYGASWLQPTNVLGGRMFKFGFQLDM